MLTNSDIRKINDICKKIDTVFNINKGGCCYLAYLIATLFEEKQIPYKIAIQGECAIEFSNNIVKTKLCKHDCSKCCWVNNYHILLKTNNKYINKIKKNKLLFIKDGSSDDILEVYTSTQWRKNYDVKNNEKVKSIINDTFRFNTTGKRDTEPVLGHRNTYNG